MDVIRIGRTILELRLARHWSQVQLAQKADMNDGYLSRLERGLIESPGSDILSRIARALGVPLWRIMGEHIPESGDLSEVIEAFAAYMTPEEFDNYKRKWLEMPDEYKRRSLSAFNWLYDEWRNTREAKRAQVHQAKEQARILGADPLKVAEAPTDYQAELEEG